MVVAAALFVTKPEPDSEPTVSLLPFKSKVEFTMTALGFGMAPPTAATRSIPVVTVVEPE